MLQLTDKQKQLTLNIDKVSDLAPLVEDIFFDPESKINFCLYNDETFEYTKFDATTHEIAEAIGAEIDDKTQMVDYGDGRGEDYVGEVYINGDPDWEPEMDELITFLYYKIRGTE